MKGSFGGVIGGAFWGIPAWWASPDLALGSGGGSSGPRRPQPVAAKAISTTRASAPAFVCALRGLDFIKDITKGLRWDLKLIYPNAPPRRDLTPPRPTPRPIQVPFSSFGNTPFSSARHARPREALDGAMGQRANARRMFASLKDAEGL